MKRIIRRAYRKKFRGTDGAFFKKGSGKEFFSFESGSQSSFFHPATNTLNRKLQKKDAGNSTTPAASINSYVNSLNGKGNSLPGHHRQFFSARMGHDFSNVKIHTGNEASQSASAINAQAYTYNNHIVFNKNKFQPETIEGKKLIAHELAHVVQQNKFIYPKIQRRLLLSATNIAEGREYLDLVGSAAGLILGWAPPAPRVTNLGNAAAPATSPSGRSILLQILNHSSQHAEMVIGSHQPGVDVGAFPPAGSSIQRVDIDDIRNMNVAIPGQGTALAYHEMFENFNAHASPRPGFGPSHSRAIQVESDVLEDLHVPGRRLDSSGVMFNIPDSFATLLGLPTGPNISYVLFRETFTHYFWDSFERHTVTATGLDVEIVTALRTPKVLISQRTINNFASGSNIIPMVAASILAATLADLRARPSATLLLEGFADSTGDAPHNVQISRRRAEAVRNIFIGVGLAADRIAIVGRGETNFAASNNTPANRALNRRVVMSVHN